jgi:radical SAM protein with 4Fe4S-binding SPASM domain
MAVGTESTTLSVTVRLRVYSNGGDVQLCVRRASHGRTPNTGRCRVRGSAPDTPSGGLAVPRKPPAISRFGRWRDLVAQLVDELECRGWKNRLSIHLGHVEVYNEGVGTVEGSAMTRAEFAAVEATFDAAMLMRGWTGRSFLPRRSVGTLCTADNPQGYVLSPGSNVFRCWNEAADEPDHAWGRIQASGRVDRMRDSHVYEQYDPFSHAPCQTCRVAPLCRGGCPWEASKSSVSDPGHCSTLRYNLPDRLRLYALSQQLLGAGRAP